MHDRKAALINLESESSNEPLHEYCQRLHMSSQVLFTMLKTSAEPTTRLWSRNTDTRILHSSLNTQGNGVHAWDPEFNQLHLWEKLRKNVKELPWKNFFLKKAAPWSVTQAASDNSLKWVSGSDKRWTQDCTTAFIGQRWHHKEEKQDHGTQMSQNNRHHKKSRILSTAGTQHEMEATPTTIWNLESFFLGVALINGITAESQQGRAELTKILS